MIGLAQVAVLVVRSGVNARPEEQPLPPADDDAPAPATEGGEP